MRKPVGTLEQACERAARFANRGNRSLKDAERFINRCGWGDSFFGVETANFEPNSEPADCLEYLNSGDTYSITIACELDTSTAWKTLQPKAGSCFVTTWGDWYEEKERSYQEDNGLICCGHCGYFSAVHPDNWRESVCDNCNHKAGE